MAKMTIKSLFEGGHLCSKTFEEDFIKGTSVRKFFTAGEIKNEAVKALLNQFTFYTIKQLKLTVVDVINHFSQNGNIEVLLKIRPEGRRYIINIKLL